MGGNASNESQDEIAGMLATAYRQTGAMLTFSFGISVSGKPARILQLSMGQISLPRESGVSDFMDTNMRVFARTADKD